MIIRARDVVTMEGEPIANGAVAIAGNKILDLGQWPEVRGRNSGEVLDLGARILLPGLINAHCHLDYTDFRGVLAAPSSFTDWIRAINHRKAAWSEAEYVRSIRHGFEEAKKFGTTTIVNFAAFPGLIGKLSPVPLRSWWLAEMIDLREKISPREVYQGLRALTSRDSLLKIGLAPHAPFSASRKLYAETAALAAEHDIVLSTHLAESREEMQMFRDGRGPLYDFMQSFGRPIDDCGTTTPLAHFLGQNLADREWLIAHLNELTEDDFRLLRESLRLSVVHCPRSHAYFNHSRFPLTRLRRLGFNIALGTDSLASNADLSLFAEMRALWESEPSLQARELLEMVTMNPARALRQEDRLGALRPGSLADMVAVPSTGSAENLFEEIVGFEGAVPWMMINGRLVADT